MEPLRPSPLAEVLGRGRERFNARFAQTVALGRPLDGEAFKAHLRDVVEPIAEAVSRVRPDRIDAVVTAAYDVSVELMGAGLLGPGQRHPAVGEGWRQVLPAVPWLLAEHPLATIGTVTNALYNLSLQRGARPRVWIEAMAAIGPEVTDLAVFRAAGHVVAWRSGMPQHRLAALDSCRALPSALALRALGAGAGADGAGLPHAIDRMQADPWLKPERALGAPGKRTLRIVSVAGGFRGFGGVFRTPPRVTAARGGGLIARDLDDHWLLEADVFGTSLQRLQQVPPRAAAGGDSPVDARGRVSLDDCAAQFDELREPTSFAALPPTLAVTVPRSHLVFLLGLQ